jgi:hypothetical protein
MSYEHDPGDNSDLNQAIQRDRDLWGMDNNGPSWDELDALQSENERLHVENDLALTELAEVRESRDQYRADYMEAQASAGTGWKEAAMAAARNGAKLKLENDRLQHHNKQLRQNQDHSRCSCVSCGSRCNRSY